MKESEVIEDYISKLDPYFKMYREVDGRSLISGKLKRIDLIMVSRDIPIGQIKPMAFGVEFKADQMESMNDYTSWLRQAIGYTQCKWGNSAVQLPILVAPFINREYCGEVGKIQSGILSRIAGQFGIGELGLVKYDRDYGYGMYEMKIKMADTRLWSSSVGWNSSLVKMDFKKRYTL